MTSRPDSLPLRTLLKQLFASPIFLEVTRHVRLPVALAALTLLSVAGLGLIAVEYQAQFLSRLGTQGETVGGHDLLLSLFLSYVLAQSLYELSQFLKRYFQNKISYEVTLYVKRRIYGKILESESTQLAGENSGELTQRFSSDAVQLGGVWAEGILSFLLTLTMVTVVSFFLTLQIGPPGVSFFLVLIGLTTLARRFSERSVPLIQSRAEESASRLAEIQQAIGGMATLKMLGAEPRFLSRIFRFAAREEQARLEANRVNSRYLPVFATLRWVGWALILLWVVFLEDPSELGSSSAPAGQQSMVALIFALNWYSALLQDSFLFIGTYLNMVQVGVVSARRLDEILAKSPATTQFAAPRSAENVIEVDNVIVEYPTRPGIRVLDGFTASFRRGGFYVIVGRFGTGKTSILRAILGDLVPLHGQVRRAEGLSIAFVSQDSFLHSASVRDVVRFAFSNVNDEDGALKEILQTAQFSSDLAALEEGLGTYVGDRGVALSGGQKQRLSLARAAYFDTADTVVLDDPLSALDRATAIQITRNLILGTWQRKTRILTTHRLECATHADAILVLDNGRLAALGTHAELLAQNAFYQELWAKSLI